VKDPKDDADVDAEIKSMRYIVRRLTPRECERLMGLPDGYTIPVMEVTDELVAEFVEIHNRYAAIMAAYAGKKPPKPKTAKQVRKWLEKITNPETCPDAPRCKVCGNGWAVNCARWVCKRIQDVDEKGENKCR
jgi:DNA (cytosine-5)-methyltransferase 1